MTATKNNPSGQRGDLETGSVRQPIKDESETTTRQPLRPRLVAHALPYLASLLTCTEDEAWSVPVTFQVFDDTPRKDRKRARIFHGSLDEFAEDLDARNAEGDGIFVAVNQTDGRGREKKNIIALRSAWADLDEKAAAEPFNMAALPLSPSMAVRSGHGTHLYWIFPKTIPCDAGRQAEHEALLRSIQKTLEPFGADAQVCQVAGVLRLPGFYNVKREPVLVEVLR